ncbi:MAG: hypothetical protein JWN04_5120, partial [Myxococcaceae bacterium]|nr:hypothetical protein [Myxococcaceae bacterium]
EVVPAGGVPVVAFLPGGAFRLGSGADLDGARWSADKQLIVVGINYRLGALGSLVLPALDDALALPSGNQALRDQQLALRWLQRNIAAFGGDPAKVTLFGQSAGAQCACMQLFAQGSEELVQRVVLDSGSCVHYPAIPLVREKVRKVSEELAAALCPDASDLLACLRTVPAMALVDWATNMGLRPFGENFSPQVDGVFLAEDPATALQAGRFLHVPLLIGTNLDEWGVVKLCGGSEVPRPTNALELAVIVYGLYPEHAADILSLYLGSAGAESATDTLGRIVRDSWFRCPSRALLRGVTAANVKAYLFSFELAPAVHGLELDYVFGYPWVSPVLVPPAFSTAAPLPLLPQLVTAMQGYWSAFALSGDPNTEGQPEWPAHELESDRHLVLSHPISTGSALSTRECALWDSFY